MPVSSVLHSSERPAESMDEFDFDEVQKQPAERPNKDPNRYMTEEEREWLREATREI